MSIFYNHGDQQFINFNDLTREQLAKLYNNYDEFMEFMDNLKVNDIKSYLKILRLLTKDTYVYLNYCSICNDQRIEDKELLNSFSIIKNEETLETFMLTNDDEIIEFGMYFVINNPLFKTRCFMELTEEQNQKICKLYPEHLLDLQSYKEDFGVKEILDYYHYLCDSNDSRFLNIEVAHDIIQFLNYLYAKDIYLFEKTIGEVRNKIYKWNKYLVDNNREEDILEDEQSLINLLEESTDLELGELALENKNVMNEMLFQLFDYEIDKCEIIIDENGKNVKVTEAEVDEYMKKLNKVK